MRDLALSCTLPV
uniref:Uncharacterized protein n=1 Tax=Arundo donax TaxID=35708 RepID=A0A0A9B527_ARUDO